jgi:hypothetical protein
MQKQRGEAYHEASKQSRLEHLDTDYQPGKSAFKVKEVLTLLRGRTRLM